jgi:hypothetical protein
MFYSVPTNHNCLCVYSESVPRSRATVTNMYNLMHMWHHVTNHLIISNDKDSNSENRINYASVTLPPFLRVDVRVGLCKLSRILPRQGRVEIRCQFSWSPGIFGIEFQYFILSVL